MEVPEPHGTILTARHLQMKEKGEKRIVRDEECGEDGGVEKEGEKGEGKEDNIYHEKW